MRWPLQPLQPFQQTQLQPPFGQSVDSLCHPWFTTTNVSYRFPILKLPPPPCAVLLVRDTTTLLGFKNLITPWRHWYLATGEGALRALEAQMQMIKIVISIGKLMIIGGIRRYSSLVSNKAIVDSCLIWFIDIYSVCHEWFIVAIAVRSSYSSQRSQMSEPTLQAARPDDLLSNAGSRRSTQSKGSRVSRASGSNASRRVLEDLGKKRSVKILDFSQIHEM